MFIVIATTNTFAIRSTHTSFSKAFTVEFETLGLLTIALSGFWCFNKLILILTHSIIYLFVIFIHISNWYIHFLFSLFQCIFYLLYLFSLGFIFSFFIYGMISTGTILVWGRCWVWGLSWTNIAFNIWDIGTLSKNFVGNISNRY